MAWGIELYETESARCPVREFVEQLTAKTQAKVARSIDLLEQFGMSLEMPHARPLGGTSGLRELRITHSGNDYRVFFFNAKHEKIVLLHAIVKKSRATPQRDLDTALQRRADYERRNP